MARPGDEVQPTIGQVLQQAMKAGLTGRVDLR
jgi:hypothetical protein